jgi:hypothetical protein
VKLAAFAARVGFRRQIVQKGNSETPPNKGRQKLFPIHAGKFGTNPADTQFWTAIHIQAVG